MSSAPTSTTTPACLHSSYILIRSAFISAILSAFGSARSFTNRQSPREEEERSLSLFLHATDSAMILSISLCSRSS
jgi:hypothetical protein